MDIKVGRKAIAEATEKLKNWGRWGKDDQIGTLNHVRPEDIVKAASLIRTGKVFALGIPLDANGPQNGLFGGRFNPIHQMLATGTDAIAGRQDWNKIRYADDTLICCVQGATHWDALGHVFYEDKAYNGYDAKLIDSKGLNVLGIEHSKNKMVGRGVLLDIARFRGVPWMADGESISNDELDKCAKDQNVSIGRGDFVIIRTGQMERCLHEKQWGGYAGGDAPGVKFENCYWCQEKEIAAICTDTWGVEVRPNETTEANQPWHWVVIPAMGLCMGEIFYLKELAEDCDEDGVYEFFFCGPPLDHHRRHRLAAQSAGDQMTLSLSLTGEVASGATPPGPSSPRASSRIPALRRRSIPPAGEGERSSPWPATSSAEWTRARSRRPTPRCARRSSRSSPTSTRARTPPCASCRKNSTTGRRPRSSSRRPRSSAPSAR